MTLSKKRKIIAVLATVGLAFFFLAPAVPVQGHTSVAASADSFGARHCRWKTINYTWLEYRSIGARLFGVGCRFVKYNFTTLCY